MKKLKLIFAVLTISVLLTSCGIHRVVVSNTNNNVTNVELSKKNFTVISKVSGTSTATYVFGLGGMINKSLVEKARTQMLENANLVGTARAIVNVTIEEHINFVYILFVQKTITVSGHVVEFTEK